jgi:hypothetical protein
MNVLVNILFIMLILWIAFATYMTIFRGWAEWHWKLRNFGWFLPDDKENYIKYTRVLHVVTLLALIGLYVLILTDVI